MKELRILYHMARADFFERTRRYSFLVMLGLVLWIGYLSASGQFRMRVPPDYLGVINSAWVGATMTITVTLLLGWVGFYLVKGSVSRDYETGVGQIMATTPLSRPLYMFGKWVSNFSVLGIMILILMIMGIFMNLLFGAGDFNFWALAAPMIVIALPCMAMIAAMAVLFESIFWLRAGLGNIIYFILFMFALAVSAGGMPSAAADKNYNPFMDFAGFQLIGSNIAQAAKVVYPESTGGFAFSITYLEHPRLFPWNGIQWTPEILLARFLPVLVAVGIVLLAAAFFDRFNPSRVLNFKRKPVHAPIFEGIIKVEPGAVAFIHLTPLPDARRHFNFGQRFVTEIKLLLKGCAWWWYTTAAGLILAQCFSDLEVMRLLLIFSWVWPILILGALGCRESRWNTRQIVFSVPRPLMNQLPTIWLAAICVLAVLGSGGLIRFVISGDTLGLMGWITGLIFIPSLALLCGVLTGSSKTFEALYILWMYMLTQKVPLFDFICMAPGSIGYVYIPLSIMMLIITVFVRQSQIRNL